MHSVLLVGNLSGQQATWREPDGKIRVFMQVNDRGRGPKTYSTYRLDQHGVPELAEIVGNDYMKNAVEERFGVADGKATWKSSAESGTEPFHEQFFSSLSGPAEELAMMARAMLANGGKTAMLPVGGATIESVRTIPVAGAGAKVHATLYAITGLDVTPSYLWLDEKQQLFAVGGTWAMVIKQGFESASAELVKVQQEVDQERARELRKRAVATPAGDLVIVNANLFDAQTGKVRPGQTVTVRGNRIAAIEASPPAKTDSKATVIDARGATLLPGFWDMHQHLSGSDPLFDIATGVTTGRDLANDIDDLTALRKRIDSGEEIGPRIIPAGFIDGPGPFQGPTKILAADEKQAREYVGMYAKLGYPQIKIYSSLKPEIVPAIYNEAHKRGIRVSGHIPAGMTAGECVKLGQDEIQHMNFIFLNFMPDVKETRNPARFIEPGKRAAGMDLASPGVRDFIRLLKEHHTVVDPTMTAWESTYTDRPGEVSHNFTAIADRLPATIQRRLKTAEQALPVTPETDKLYRASYDKFKAMLKLLYDSGVTIVPGTDNFAGFAYQRELEIYVESGIPAPEVLRLATLGSARVMKKDKELGSIEVGKLADMVLVEGDPSKNIGNIRKVRTVIKDGQVYDPAKILNSLGVRP